jgi:hypothetical protein
MGFKKISALPIAVSLLALMVRSLSPVALAQESTEIVITSNGSGSSNTVEVTQTTTTQISQSNEANISNEVAPSANTGGNEASANAGGDATISTGDVEEEVVIVNEANYSSVDVGCCPGNTQVGISGNGAGSENQVALEKNLVNDINVNQSASISNTVSGSANTGYNTASFNGGDVAIDTGNIGVAGGIVNGPVNISDIQGGSGGGGISATISNNAAFSNNLIAALFADLSNINTNYSANIQNGVYWDLNTGGNSAIANNGEVTIRTGDILFDFIIHNGPINVGGVSWGCCIPPHDGDGDGDGGPTPGDGDGDADGGGGGGGGGDGGAAAGGGVILALAETSGDAYPTVLIGLAMIAAGASLVNQKKFV